MAEVIMVDVEDDVAERLRRRARSSGTSLEQFARNTLEEAARPSKDEVIAESDRLRSMTQRRLDDSTFLIREDRDVEVPQIG